MTRQGARSGWVWLSTALPAAVSALLFALAGMPGIAMAAVSVLDDLSRTVSLPAPATRIVSLAPHATELLFNIGAGRAVVGAIDFSDFPPEARQIPSVGSAAAFDIERIVALRPQLVVAWGSGNNAARVQQLRDLGIPVFVSEPRHFDTIASSLERLAELTGNPVAGTTAARRFRLQVRALKERHAERPPVRVFYQVWQSPLMTLNDQHLVSHAIALCGGENVFGTLPQLAPVVGIEDVLQRNPEVIINASGGPDDPGLAIWARFQRLTAVRRANLVTIDADLLTRGTPRILQGTEAICQALELARSRRDKR